MAHLTPATPLGLYGPFHCLTPNPSPGSSPYPSPPPSRSSRSTTPDSAVGSTIGNTSCSSSTPYSTSLYLLSRPSSAASTTAPPPSSISRSPSSLSISSIRSINRILSLRRDHRSRSRRQSVLCGRTVTPRSVGPVPSSSSTEKGQGLASLKGSSGAQTEGLMEPRPTEGVGWGIGEVLWGGKY